MQGGQPNGAALASLAKRLGQLSTVGVMRIGTSGEAQLAQMAVRFGQLVYVRGWR